MVKYYPVFETLTNDDELENEFQAFFSKYNLTKLFSNEYRVSHNITVTHVDILSVVKESGAYHKVLVKLANLLTVADDNKKYDEAVFKILHEAQTFQKMMNIAKRIIQEDASAIIHGREHNLWNIVFYTKSLF